MENIEEAIKRIEKCIVDETAYIKRLEAKDAERYELAILVAGETELLAEEELRNYYPHAFDRDFSDEELYNELSYILDKEHYLDPNVILNVTKIVDNDKVYVCKVRSFHNGKFVNNYVQIYLDGNYKVEEKKQLDAELTCSAICYAVGHEFVAVLEIKEV